MKDHRSWRCPGDQSGPSIAAMEILDGHLQVLYAKLINQMIDLRTDVSQRDMLDSKTLML